MGYKYIIKYIDTINIYNILIYYLWMYTTLESLIDTHNFKYSFNGLFNGVQPDGIGV